MKKILGLIAIIAFATSSFSYAQSKTDLALNKVLNTYYEVKNALAADNKNLAIEKVKTLTANVNAVPHLDLSADQNKIWMQQAAILKSKAAQFVGSNDIKTQRKSFEGISSAMLKTLRNLKFNTATVFVQHCPMAKASWLNEKEKIENPYYGSMMFECGDISETIKSK